MRAWIGSARDSRAVPWPLPIGQTRPKGLDIYVVDVEGGNATLFVSPSGESVLIDSGNGGAGSHARRRPHHGRGQGRRPHARSTI